MALGDIVKYNASLTQEQKVENARRAGLASAEAKRERQTLAEIVQVWANNKCKNKDVIDQLRELGIENPTNKSTLILPLLRNVNEKGDTKAMAMLVELLNEDRKKEAEIRKLETEIELLKKQISGEIETNKILVVNDIPKIEEE